MRDYDLQYHNLQGGRLMNKKHDYVLFLKYIVTYVITLGVFFALIVPIYLKTYEAIRKNSVNESYKKLNAAVGSLDIMVSKMYDVSRLVEQDTYFFRLSGVEGSIELREYYSLSKAQELVRRAAISYDLPVKLYVMFEKNDIFVSNIITLDEYQTVFAEHLSYEKISPEKLKAALFAPVEQISFLPAQKIKYLDKKTYDAITCVVKMGMRSYTDFDSVVVFTLDTAQILDMVLSQPADKDSFVYITDTRGNVVFDYNYGREPLQHSDGIAELGKVNGIKYTVLSSESKLGQLNVTIGIPERVFYAETKTVINIIWLYLIIAIAIALVFSGLFALRRVKGIKQILDVLNVKNAKPMFDEYGYIKSAVGEAIVKNVKYEREIEIARNSLKKTALEHLLMEGVYSEKEKANFTSLFGIVVEYFVVAVTDLKRVRGREEECQIVNVEILKRFEAYMGTRVLDYNASITETVFLICLPPDYPSSTSGLQEFMLGLSEMIEEKHGIDMFAGISSIGVDADNVHICYLQAKNALRQIIYPYSQRVNKYTKQDGEYNALMDYSISQQLHDLIITGDAEAVTALFNKITKRIDVTSFETEQDIMQLFFSLRNPVFNAYVEVYKDDSRSVVPGYKASYTIFEILQLFNQLALDICLTAKQRKRSANLYLKQSILKHLHDNYTDVSICAMSVAKAFSITEKYVYAFVKEQTCKTFGEYLEGIRMEKAKFFLLNTGESINKISEQIGFNSVNTFYKAFNRFYGMAPGKYRENCKRED